MKHYHSPQPYLVVCKSNEDAVKIDAATQQDQLGVQKLGATSYLAFLFQSPSEFDVKWRQKLGLTDELHWVPLPAVEVTKT